MAKGTAELMRVARWPCLAPLLARQRPTSNHPPLNTSSSDLSKHEPIDSFSYFCFMKTTLSSRTNTRPPARRSQVTSGGGGGGKGVRKGVFDRLLERMAREVREMGDEGWFVFFCSCTPTPAHPTPFLESEADPLFHLVYTCSARSLFIPPE